jgi:ribosomal protein S27AE
MTSVRVESQVCPRCGPVMAMRNTHGLRNSVGLLGASLTGGLSLLGTKVELPICPKCGQRINHIPSVGAAIGEAASEAARVVGTAVAEARADQRAKRAKRMEAAGLKAEGENIRYLTQPLKRRLVDDAPAGTEVLVLGPIRHGFAHIRLRSGNGWSKSTWGARAKWLSEVPPSE